MNKYPKTISQFIRRKYGGCKESCSYGFKLSELKSFISSLLKEQELRHCAELAAVKSNRMQLKTVIKAERKKYEDEFKRLIKVFKKNRKEPMTGQVVALELEVAFEELQEDQLK